MQSIGKKAKDSAFKLRNISTTTKNDVIFQMADNLEKEMNSIIEANRIDLENAVKNNVEEVKINRLALNETKIKTIIKGLKDIALLPDSINEVISSQKRPNGMEIGLLRVPLGVIGLIYESRPNVTADAIGLCIKSNNAIILRGGSEAINSNLAIAEIMYKSAISGGLPENCIQIIKSTDKQYVDELLKLKDFIDVIIPRGGKSLIQKVIRDSLVPTIETGIGIVSIFVNQDADFEMADKIIVNSKCSYPSACNSLDKLLIHEKIKDNYIPRIISLLRKNNVEIRGFKKAKAIDSSIITAEEEDLGTEYLSLKIVMKVVKDIDEAIDIITQYDSMHTESILTNSYKDARKFLNEVDAAAVYVNASTRLTDGSVFGLGAEMGISTQKLHARGPFGINQLTSTKYIIYGDGQIRE